MFENIKLWKFDNKKNLYKNNLKFLTTQISEIINSYFLDTHFYLT
jgi:hypothetical protein